jgi:hypothetical protein
MKPDWRGDISPLYDQYQSSVWSNNLHLHMNWYSCDWIHLVNISWKRTNVALVKATVFIPQVKSITETVGNSFFPNVQNCILAAWPACLLVLLTLDMDFDTLTSTQQYLEVHSAWREDRRVGPMQSRPNEYECLNLDEVDKDNGSICLSLPIDTSLCQYHEYVVSCYKFIPRTRLVEW